MKRDFQEAFVENDVTIMQDVHLDTEESESESFDSDDSTDFSPKRGFFMEKMVLFNFKSYRNVKEIGPFEKVKA